MCMSPHWLSYQQGGWESHAWADLIVLDPFSEQEFVCDHNFVYSFIQQIPSFIDSAGSSIHLNISLLIFVEYSSPPPPKKSCTLCHVQQIWADKISLDYKAHFTVSLTLDTPARGLVRHADGDGDGAAVLSHLSLSVAFAKGHSQEASDMTSSSSICMPWLLCGLNITDAFQTTGAVGHFSVEAAESYTRR